MEEKKEVYNSYTYISIVRLNQWQKEKEMEPSRAQQSALVLNSLDISKKNDSEKAQHFTQGEKRKNPNINLSTMNGCVGLVFEHTAT